MSGAIPGGPQQNMSGKAQTGLSVGLPGSPWVDTKTGAPTPVFFQLIYSLLQRTGGTLAPSIPGPSGFPLIGLSAVENIANEALTDAQSALALAELVALSEEDVFKIQNSGTSSSTSTTGIAFTTLFSDDLGQAGSENSQGEIWAPLANGDPPGAIIPGIPHGFILGPTLVALPNGSCVMVRIR